MTRTPQEEDHDDETPDALQAMIEALPEALRPKFRILDPQGNLIPATLLEWARFQEDSSHRLLHFTRHGPYEVSTIFLGLDHSFDHTGKWFETMVFGPEEKISGQPPQFASSLWCYRCGTFQETWDMHARAIRWLKDEGLVP
jgi:hypothetical protein